MFKLRREHMEAFRPLVWSQIGVRLTKALANTGATVEHNPGSLTIKDHRGGTSRLFFRDDGLVSGLKGPEGTLYSLDHDKEGRISKISYPNGDHLSLEYDAKSRLQRLTRNGAASHAFQYDSEGRILSVTYPDGSVSRRSYHPEGGISESWDRTGALTRYERDNAGDLLAIIDPLGRSTLYVRGGGSGASAIQFPDGTQERFGYQRPTKTISIHHPGGQQTEKKFSSPGKIQFVQRDNDTYEFDGDGNLTKAVSSEGVVERKYDSYGRLTNERAPTGIAKYDYDDDGRLSSLSHGSRGQVNFSYNADCRLFSIRDWGGRETKLTYEPGTNTVLLRHANGLQERRTYASYGRLTDASVSDDRGRVLARQAYAYDGCERLLKSLDSSGLRNQEREFDYDRENRLVRESDGGARRPIFSFGYDGKGNLVQDGGVPIIVGSMDEPRQHGETRIDYSTDGHMINPLNSGKGALNCTYSPNGLLKSVTVGSRRITFGYDALQRRVWKREAKKITKYGWASHNLVWEQSQDESSGLETWRDYLYLPGSFVPLCFREDGHVFWIESDARGAVSRVYDEKQALVWRASYEPFGKVLVDLATIRQPWRMLGHYEDEETGLYYNLCRYYCPSTKSYLSRDPSWYKPFAQNYGYARNSPWNYVDPLGSFSGVPTATLAGPASTAPLAESFVMEAGGAAVVEAGVGTAVEIGTGAAILEGAGTVALVSNPVGWFILGIIGLVALGVLIYVAVESSQPQACMSCAASSEKSDAPAVPMSEGGSSGPPKDRCTKAIKLLEQYERLAKKFGKNLPPKRIKKLNDLRDRGVITSNDLPGSIGDEMPGEFKGKTLDEIKKICGMR